MLGFLAERALGLLVARVPDEQDRVATPGEPPGFVVHLADQRAGRVHYVQFAQPRLLPDARGDAVRREHHGGTRGHLVQLLDEHRAAPFQVGHHDGVVHDLLAHVDRTGPLVKQPGHDVDGPLHPGTERPRTGQQHPPVSDRGGPRLEHRPEPAQRAQRGQARACRGRMEQRPARRVDHDPEHGKRPAVGRRGQHRRLHVHGQRACRGQLGPLRPVHHVVGRHDRPGVHGQPRRPQRADQQRRRRARDHAVGGPHLRGHHDIPGGRSVGQRATDTGDRQRGGLAGPQRASRPAGPGRSHPGAHDQFGRQATPHGHGLHPQRRGHQEVRHRWPPGNGQARTAGTPGGTGGS